LKIKKEVMQKDERCKWFGCTKLGEIVEEGLLTYSRKSGIWVMERDEESW